MKDKQTKVKKVKKGLKIALISALIAGTITTGAAAIHKNVELNDYASTSQIVSVMDELDCDSSYLTKYGSRFLQMEHNGDEPIYVCFDESLNEKEIESAKKSLDEIFGIVGKINKHYRYEIVSKAEYYSKINRTKIYYDLSKVDSVCGYVIRKPSLISMLTSKKTYNNYRLFYNRENNINAEEMNYTFMHELFHAFGVEDLYHLKKGVRIKPKAIKSLIDTDYGDGTSKLTPNDVKCLISLYQEKKDSKEEQDDYLNEMKQLLQDYEKEYYSVFANKCKEKTEYGCKFDERKINTISSIDIPFGKQKWARFRYDVKILENKYKFTIKNESGEILDSCNGKVVWANDVAILKDVTLKDGLYPEMPEGYVKFDEFVQDFALLKNEENNIFLYDLGTNYLYPSETLELSHTNNELGV